VNARSTLVPTAASCGARLDVYLARELENISRVRARELIRSGEVLVDGHTARPSHRVENGQCITVELPLPAPIGLTAEPMDLHVVYEDGDMAVIDKPAGLVVHPGPGHPDHTLVHGLLSRLGDLGGIGGVLRPGIVHRLDMDTSGLLAVAKTERGHASLSEQFASRSVKKGYLALLCGHPGRERGLIDAPIGRDPQRRRQMAIMARGRAAQTRYASIERINRFTFALAMPLTGRTHQIRVHFASIGCPIAADELYGGWSGVTSRQFLHAAFLRFARPGDGEKIELSSPLPEDLCVPLLRLAGDEPAGRRIEEMVELARKHFQHEGS